jgi:hypoxanthine phosphoribosyltransferase
MNMRDDIAEILYTEEQLAEIVSRMGRQISEDYEGKNLFMISVLKGSLIFMADLMRAVTVPCSIDFLSVSSYGKGTVSSGAVRILKDLDDSLEGKDLLVVEDILDSGVTLSFLLKNLSARNPRSIRLCTLLDKPERRKVDIRPDYVGAEVPDEFIVGYGLDYAEKYRNLPYIGVLKPEVYAG